LPISHKYIQTHTHTHKHTQTHTLTHTLTYTHTTHIHTHTNTHASTHTHTRTHTHTDTHRHTHTCAPVPSLSPKLFTDRPSHSHMKRRPLRLFLFSVSMAAPVRPSIS